MRSAYFKRLVNDRDISIDQEKEADKEIHFFWFGLSLHTDVHLDKSEEKKISTCCD